MPAPRPATSTWPCSTGRRHQRGPGRRGVRSLLPGRRGPRRPPLRRPGAGPLHHPRHHPDARRRDQRAAECRGRPRNHDPLHAAPDRPRARRHSASPRPHRRSSRGAARLGRMPAVRPFRAITYAPERFAQPVIPERIRLPDEPDAVLAGRRVTDLTDLACPPYDVISRRSAGGAAGAPRAQRGPAGAAARARIRTHRRLPRWRAWHGGWHAGAPRRSHRSTTTRTPRPRCRTTRPCRACWRGCCSSHTGPRCAPRAHHARPQGGSAGAAARHPHAVLADPGRLLRSQRALPTTSWAAPGPMSGAPATSTACCTLAGGGRAGRAPARVPVAPAAVHRRWAPSVRDRAGLPGGGAGRSGAGRSPRRARWPRTGSWPCWSTPRWRRSTSGHPSAPARWQRRCSGSVRRRPGSDLSGGTRWRPMRSWSGWTQRADAEQATFGLLLPGGRGYLLVGRPAPRPPNGCGASG